MAQPIVLMGGRVCTPEGILNGAAVTVRDGLITAVGAPEDGRRLDVGGALIAPGLIDTHLHGGLEFDTMDASPDALRAISRHLAGHGVTSWVPTTVACGADHLDRILTVVGRLVGGDTGGAEILGAHLESNFISPKYKGAQPPEHLLPTDDAAILEVLERHRETIRIFTIAPELPGALELITQLTHWGVVVSIGHTDATYDQVRAGIAAGARRVTHLCNAQRGFHHREPGVVGAALVSDEVTAELIADLVHVHPAGIQVAYRCKGAQGLALVSDAVRGTGLPPGIYDLGGQEIHLDAQSSRLADGTIAGGVVTLERAVGIAVKEAGVPWHEAIAMASAVPARSLRIADRGAIAPGLKADLAIFTDDMTCRATMKNGAWVYGEFAAEVAS
jgi:N-acetylglucosamine-6-phosphate deacetylase